MSNPRVSILMLTYNRPQMIGRAITSALEQTLSDWELIVVQDGGDSRTGELVNEWVAKDRRIRYFRRGVSGSIAEASNFGLAQARGEFVAILDDDDWWAAPNKLARQVDFLTQNLEYTGVGGAYIVVDQDGQQRGRFRKPGEDEAIRSSALMANPLANSTAMFRRVIAGQPALYDATLRQFADWDFWLTLGSQGKLCNFPEDLAYYALWPGGSSFRHIRANARAGLQIVNKHRGHYRGYAIALSGSLLYLGYAYLPGWFQRFSYGWLSSVKKALAGVKTDQPDSVSGA